MPPNLIGQHAVSHIAIALEMQDPPRYPWQSLPAADRDALAAKPSVWSARSRGPDCMAPSTRTCGLRSLTRVKLTVGAARCRTGCSSAVMTRGRSRARWRFPPRLGQ